MGLDMYAYTIATPPGTPVDFQPDDEVIIHYWRKHPDLHGWMEQLYRDKGGTDADFNCNTVVLTRADIDRLEAAIHAKMLPKTTGFFFGASDGSEEADDLAFIAKAREAFAKNLTVFYSSWW